jgi:ankyrin repeat protein
MNIKLFSMTLVLAPFFQHGVTEAMYPLSLKYTCAKKVAADLRRSVGTDQNIVTSPLGMPIEVHQYACSLGHFDNALTTLLSSLNLRDSDYQRLYHNMHSRVDADGCLGYWTALLKNLNTPHYTRQEKSVALARAAFYNRGYAKKERLTATAMLYKAIKNSHYALIQFLALNGAYLNKKQEGLIEERQQNEQELPPLFLALKTGNLNTVNILIEAREKRAAAKQDPQKQIQSMSRFINNVFEVEIAEDDAPGVYSPLAIALAVGNTELLKLIIQAIEQNGLDLYECINCHSYYFPPLFYPLWWAEAMGREYGNLCGNSSNTLENRKAALSHFLSVAHSHSVDVNKMFLFDGDEPLLSYISPDIVDFVLEQAKYYSVDLASVINSHHGEALAALAGECSNNVISTLFQHAENDNFTILGIEPALLRAAEENNLDLIEFFMEHGVSVNLHELLNKESVIRSIVWRIPRKVNFYASACKELSNLLDFAKRYAVTLHGLQHYVESAKSSYDMEAIDQFIKHGIALDLASYLHERQRNNETPLMAISSTSFLKNAQCLLDLAERFTIDLPDLPEALAIAAERRNIKMLKVLLSKLNLEDARLFLDQPNVQQLIIELLKAEYAHYDQDPTTAQLHDVKLLIELYMKYGVMLKLMPEALELAQNSNIKIN